MAAEENIIEEIEEDNYYAILNVSKEVRWAFWYRQTWNTNI